MKTKLTGRSAKTVNNILTVLNTMLRTAVEWGVIETMPCRIRLLPTITRSAAFHDFEAFDRLVMAAQEFGSTAKVIVLLGGHAGLRCGEMMALEWTDVDLVEGQLTVARSDWKGQVTAPKGGRIRHVPLTDRLTAALNDHPRVRGRRVLTDPEGQPLTQKAVQCIVRRAALRAGVSPTGVHVLRHTFCSHLAMKGAAAKAIQEFAGH